MRGQRKKEGRKEGRKGTGSIRGKEGKSEDCPCSLWKIKSSTTHRREGFKLFRRREGVPVPPRLLSPKQKEKKYVRKLK